MVRRIDGPAHRWSSEQMVLRTDGPPNRWSSEQMVLRTDGPPNRWSSEQMVLRTDGPPASFEHEDPPSVGYDGLKALLGGSASSRTQTHSRDQRPLRTPPGRA